MAVAMTRQPVWFDISILNSARACARDQLARSERLRHAAKRPQAPTAALLVCGCRYCCCCCCVWVFCCCAAFLAASSALYSSRLRSYQPIQEKPISSMVRPVPAPTQFFGSGLCLLDVVLSYQLTTCSN